MKTYNKAESILDVRGESTIVDLVINRIKKQCETENLSEIARLATDDILFDSNGFVDLEKPKNTTCFVKSMSLLNKDSQITNSIFMGDLLTLSFDVECKSKIEDFEISVFTNSFLFKLYNFRCN